MAIYNLIEYSNNYSKTSGSLYQYYKDDPNDNIAQSESFKSKIKITGKTPTNGDTKDAELIVPLRYLDNFWRHLEMLLINCDVILLLTWSKDCAISSANGELKFDITKTKLYIPVKTLSTQDNAKLLQQLKSGFKRTTNWNHCESSVKIFAKNRNLNHLINQSFQGVNRLFDIEYHSQLIIFQKVEIKDYNVLIDGRNFFDQPINSINKTYEKY